MNIVYIYRLNSALFPLPAEVAQQLNVELNEYFI